MFRVLYVDDEPVLLNLGKTHLELSGKLLVETAASAREAFDLLRHHTYDGIISDYQMPEMDGIEFLRDIRALYQDIPFILFTGKGREEIAIDALNNGADFYLQKGGQTKPQFAELEHAVIHVIDRKQVRDALKESQQQMTDLINFLPDATFAIDLENKVIAWNRAMEEMTGILNTAILGTGDYSYAVPFYGERRPILVNLILTKDKNIEKRYPYLQKQGDKLISELFVPNLYNGKGAYVWFIASPLYDIRGNVIGAIEAIRDITERKDAEDNLVRTNEELHAAYEQLTATEEGLRQNFDELNRSQLDLHKSEERYRSVVEDQTEFICRFMPDGKLSFVNEAYCRYFGLNRETCLMSPHTVVIPPDDLKLVGQHLSALTPDNPVAIVEHRIVMPNGEVRWQRWSDRAIFDANGTITEYQSVGRDTTKRKTAEEKLRQVNEELHAAYEQLTATEEALRQNYDELSKSEHQLRQSEERYRNVVEDQTEFICRFTPDGKLSFVNEAYCRYFRLNRETCLGFPHTVVIPPDDLKLMKQHLSALTPDNPVAIVEHRILMATGEIRWQRWSDRAIFDTSSRIVEYQSVGRDITERKAAEEKLKQVNEELHAAYEQLTATEEELRQNYDELSKSQLALQKSEERYRNIIEDQTEFICRFTPDGKLSFVNEAYSRYFGLDRETCLGNPHTVIIPPDDLALMKQHLSTLTPDNPVAIIEHRIIMPNGEIRWQQWSDRATYNARGELIEYQSVGRDITQHKRLERALQESNKKLNLLSSITRHDILNQLTVLQGSLELIDLKLIDPEHKPWLEKAVHASEGIKSQISFTRQYQDIGVQAPKWHNIYSSVLSVCMDDGISNVSIDRQLKEIEIFADPLLRTVFSNLFENTVMHGGNATRIWVEGFERPEGFRLIVEDDGAGVDPADKKRIFQKGFGRHTGLGLFLTREVLSITGLTIEETGEHGRGARFEILVPKDMYRITCSSIYEEGDPVAGSPAPALRSDIFPFGSTEKHNVCR